MFSKHMIQIDPTVAYHRTKADHLVALGEYKINRGKNISMLAEALQVVDDQQAQECFDKLSVDEAWKKDTMQKLEQLNGREAAREPYVSGGKIAQGAVFYTVERNGTEVVFSYYY